MAVPIQTKPWRSTPSADTTLSEITPPSDTRSKRGSASGGRWAGAQVGLAQAVERPGAGVLRRVQIAGLGLQVQQAGHQLALGGAGVHVAHGGHAVCGVVVGVQLAQAQDGAVVLLHVDHLPRLDGGGDLLAAGAMKSMRLTASLCSRT
jgi:hypothetical protein